MPDGLAALMAVCYEALGSQQGTIVAILAAISILATGLNCYLMAGRNAITGKRRESPGRPPVPADNKPRRPAPLRPPRIINRPPKARPLRKPGSSFPSQWFNPHCMPKFGVPGAQRHAARVRRSIVAGLQSAIVTLRAALASARDFYTTANVGAGIRRMLINISLYRQPRTRHKSGNARRERFLSAVLEMDFIRSMTPKDIEVLHEIFGFVYVPLAAYQTAIEVLTCKGMETRIFLPVAADCRHSAYPSIAVARQTGSVVISASGNVQRLCRMLGLKCVDCSDWRPHA